MSASSRPGKTQAGAEGGIHPAAPVVEHAPDPAKPKRALMRQTELVERVKAYDPDADEALLNKAYVYAMKAHGKQFRASGDPYFAHPLEVAAILTDLKLDVATIVTALLHDTVEDTLVTYEDIKDQFRRRDRRSGRRRHQALAARTVLRAHQAGGEFPQADAGDVERHPRAAGQARRPAAQHAHAAASSQDPEKRRRIAQETLDIYAPLAGRIGMQNMREELEDLAFAELNPEARNSIVTRLARLDDVQRRPHRRASPTRSSASSPSTASRPGSMAAPSAPISIWRKLKDKQLNFEQLSDIFGFRVIVKTDGGLLPRARRPAHQLADGAGALQGFHLDAQDQRLSLHPHHA